LILFPNKKKIYLMMKILKNISKKNKKNSRKA